MRQIVIGLLVVEALVGCARRPSANETCEGAGMFDPPMSEERRERVVNEWLRKGYESDKTNTPEQTCAKLRCLYGYRDKVWFRGAPPAEADDLSCTFVDLEGQLPPGAIVIPPPWVERQGMSATRKEAP